MSNNHSEPADLVLPGEEDAGDELSVLSRRGFIWGSVGAASALAATTATAQAQRPPARKRFNYDVACLGNTLRVILAPEANPAAGNLLGSVFYVEGEIYPAGTIKRTGFNPASMARIGTWICRGWFLITPGRPNPHVITQQEYVIGGISSRRLFPPDHLASSGMEGADKEVTLVRSIVGGSGRFAGARGTVIQAVTGTNTTRLTPKALGDLGNAPNFRFQFNLM
jgi:hypothetical protein